MVLLPVSHMTQRQHGDCLVACAAMVLAYLGKPVSYNRLARTLNVQHGVGVPFSNLRTLERLKITVIYEQGTLGQLRRFLINGWPCIVCLRAENYPTGRESTSTMRLSSWGWMPHRSTSMIRPFPPRPSRLHWAILILRGWSMARIMRSWHHDTLRKN